MSTDYFSGKLLEAQFRGLGFPVSDFRMSISQDVVEHKRPDQDGASVEATGRNPIRFNAAIPFFRSLARGPNERWADLYPTAHRKFLEAMANRAVGDLVHPSFGRVRVKPVSCTTNLTAERRNGELVDAEWVEASENENESDALFRNRALAGAYAAARALDTALIERPVLRKIDSKNKLSFYDAINLIAAVFDTATLLVRRALAEIDRLSYRLTSLHRAIVSLADPKTWQVRDKIERLSASLEQLKRVGMGDSGQVSFYVVPATMTVGELATKLAMKLTELVELNPFLVRRLNVERGEVVRRVRRTNINDANRAR